MNQVRHAVISNNTLYNGKGFLDSQSTIISNTNYDVAIRKGPLLAVLTNVSVASDVADGSVGVQVRMPRSA